MVRLEKEASPTRDSCLAECARFRAARPDPSLRKERLLGITIKLHRNRKLQKIDKPLTLIRYFPLPE